MDKSKSQLPKTGGKLNKHNVAALFVDPRFDELHATGLRVLNYLKYPAVNRVVRLRSYCIQRFYTLSLRLGNIVFSITSSNSDRDSNIGQ